MKKIKICAFSDSHMRHEELKMPDADVLLIAGDVLGWGTDEELVKFDSWLGTLSYKKILYVPGNHDWELYYRECEMANAEILIDREFVFEGVKFYGTPWVTEFGDWAFQLPPKGLLERYGKIPVDTQVLIAHMPPRNVLDCVLRGGGAMMNVGSVELTAFLPDLSALKLHIFGHLHDPVNKTSIEKFGVTYANVSVLNEQYKKHRDPMVFEIDF